MQKFVATLMALAAGIETATVTFNQLLQPVPEQQEKRKVGFSHSDNLEKKFIHPTTPWIN